MLYQRRMEEEEWLVWRESNCTTQEVAGRGNLSIHEPCNYVSNVAYYHAIWEICVHDGWDVVEEYGERSILYSLSQCCHT